MNNADRARELLIEARRRISENQNTFICAAIQEAEEERRDEDRVWGYFDASYALRSWIADMLLPYSTYGHWVRYEHKQLRLGLLVFELNEKEREGRLAWIDWMLEQDLSKIVKKYKPIV